MIRGLDAYYCSMFKNEPLHKILELSLNQVEMTERQNSNVIMVRRFLPDFTWHPQVKEFKNRMALSLPVKFLKQCVP